MTTIRVRSTDGSNSDNGTTWALAKADILGADAIDAAGDFIVLSQVHAESHGVGSLSFAGTATAPTRIICANDSADPPTAETTGATIYSTSGGDMTIRGNVRAKGVEWGNSANTGHIIMAATNGVRQVHENGKFIITGTGATQRIRIGNAFGTDIEWLNVGVKFGDAGQCIDCVTVAPRFRWRRGSVLSGGTSPTRIFAFPVAGSSTPAAKVLIEDVDFSNCDAGVNIADAPETIGGSFIIRRIKLPASWSGSLLNSAFSRFGRIEMWNWSTGASEKNKLWIEDFFGSIKDEQTLVRSGGASADSSAYAHKMVSASNVNYALRGLEGTTLIKEVATVGSPLTATVEFLHDSVTALHNADIALVVDYFSDSGSLLGSYASNEITNQLSGASTTNHAASSETWTTTGLTNPNKQKLEVAFTPEQPGYVMAYVLLMKPSYTIRYCPKLAIA